MAFKMLIVDDEPIICRGLQLTVPWEEVSVEVVDIAHDGLEAIERLNVHQDIDIVLTDVRMPQKDGLELAAYLADQYPQVRTIIISGYDDFKYAQQAIHLGVKDYLLKPVNVDELLAIVKKLTGEIQEQRNEGRKRFLVNLKNAIYGQVIDSPLNGADHLEEDMDARIYPFITMMKTRRPQEFKAKWVEMVEDFLNAKGLTSISMFTNNHTLLTCVVDEHAPLSISEESFEPFLLVRNRTAIPVRDLHQTYQTLVEDCKYLPFHTDGKVISPVLEPIRETKPEYSSQTEKEFIQAIFQADWDKVKANIDWLFRYFEEMRFFLHEIIPICFDILQKVLSHYQSLFRKELPEVAPSLEGEFYSFQALKESFERNLEQIIQSFDLKKAESKDWMMERAESYIHSYYQKQLKAHEVADYINISPNYFSTLFKQKTGKSFNEYINHLRVEEAKKLLEETPFNVNEIAEQVGYREYKYFVDVFKKMTGYTPTKYRQLMANNL
ncbi:response regulator [Neobacillus pocheonensis]|uniref:response regulator transcription factor n=1 Tax=Neobacillus pocheonensis TaxID=363869 RepID=UPI003D27736F